MERNFLTNLNKNNMSESEKAYQATHKELCNQALKHYEELSVKCCHWNSLVPRAIEFYKKFGENSKFQSKEEEKKCENCKHCEGSPDEAPCCECSEHNNFQSKEEKGEDKFKEIKEAAKKIKEVERGQEPATKKEVEDIWVEINKLRSQNVYRTKEISTLREDVKKCFEVVLNIINLSFADVSPKKIDLQSIKNNRQEIISILNK